MTNTEVLSSAAAGILKIFKLSFLREANTALFYTLVPFILFDAVNKTD